MIPIIREIRNEMRSPEAYEIYSACMYRPTPEKYAAAVRDYLSDSGTHCFGTYCSGELLGILVVRGGEILGIAVRNDARCKGVGRSLIAHAKSMHPRLTAETDDDAIGFYRSCSFACQPFERTFPDGTALRWRCELKA